MHKWIKLFVLLCVLVLVAPGCSKKKNESKPTPDSKSKTVDLGESDADDADNPDDPKKPSKNKKAQGKVADTEKDAAKDNKDKDNKDKDSKDKDNAAKNNKDKNDAAKDNKDKEDGEKAGAKKPDGPPKRNKPSSKKDSEPTDDDAVAKDDAAEPAPADPEPAAEGLDFTDEDVAAEVAPPPKPPRQPRPRGGMSIEKLINIRELREQTGYSGTLQEAWLLGQNPDNRYNAMRLATDKSDELGFAVQVWKPGNETAAAKRFNDLYSQSFGGQKVKNVATDAFTSKHHKLNELCFFEKGKRATVLISCSENVCTTEQLKSIAQIIQRRL